MSDDIPPSEGCGHFFDLMFGKATGGDFDGFNRALTNCNETKEALNDLDVRYQSA